MQTLEQAESIEDDEARHSLLTYVFVGAGYAGVEGLAELQDFAADVLELYPRCQLHGMRFVLVEARDRVMPEISAGLADVRGARAAPARDRGPARHDDRARVRRLDRALDRRGGPDAHGGLDGGREAAPVVGRLGLPLDDGGRIKADRYCQVEGFDDVWAIGDAAAVPDPARPGQPRRRPASTRCARAARSAQRRRRARATGTQAAVHATRRSACSSTWAATRPSPRRSGSGGAASRRGSSPARYHLAHDAGHAQRRARLVTDWTVGLLFGRDSSELGQLGHPPVLADTGLEERSAGGTTPEGAPSPTDGS